MNVRSIAGLRLSEGTLGDVLVGNALKLMPGLKRRYMRLGG